MKNVVFYLLTISLTLNIYKSNGQSTNQKISSMQLVKEMGVGWNLGNTMDAKGKDETVWGNPVTSKAMIDIVKAQGFKTLRIPVTWQYHKGEAPDYIIEKKWLDRVEEIVNYGLKNKMFVIINIHHDEEWILATYEKAPEVIEQLKKVWTQIANRFKEYDNDLIFETLNEVRLKGSPEEWKGGSDEGRDCINQFHAACVEAIRATGGNNTNRCIMISTYAASSTQIAMDELKLPSDTNLIVSIHSYFPYELCLGKKRKNWGTKSDKKALDHELDRIHDTFVKKGTPVVMGEWGTLNHNNPKDRVKHAKYYTMACLKRGICPIWWDNGNSEKGFGILDRKNLEWSFPEIADAIIKAYKKNR